MIHGSPDPFPNFEGGVRLRQTTVHVGVTRFETLHALFKSCLPVRSKARSSHLKWLFNVNRHFKMGEKTDMSACNF